MVENKILTQQDLCKLFGVTKRTIARWCKAGLPHTRGSLNNPLFDKEEVIAWLDKRRMEATNLWGERLEKVSP